MPLVAVAIGGSEVRARDSHAPVETFLADLRHQFVTAAGVAPMLPTVRLIRRALAAIGLAVAIAGALRLRGRGGTPPQHGGWQPIDPDER